MSASSADFPCTSYRLSSRSRLHRPPPGDAVTNGADAFAAQVDEMAVGRIGRPNLALHGLKRCHRRAWPGKAAGGPAGAQCGNAASAVGDGQVDNASGIHTLHFPHYAATLPPP